MNGAMTHRDATCSLEGFDGFIHTQAEEMNHFISSATSESFIVKPINVQAAICARSEMINIQCERESPP